ncbi:hypothetical protein GYMLUDRAFT_243131 [Collybiopsis luxurians FD-317 M1]|uniref:Uncharacterized protein n=1 Tax=Collybiopsis luxurians FD-317 M1 TaxID=944289 RepID=A0A0D0CH60_9AGAR|nr:hypothetical protein GYMLUDRAFT_243131 [Collybiopsis luxurians FD-317 M1]
MSELHFDTVSIDFAECNKYIGLQCLRILRNPSQNAAEVINFVKLEWINHLLEKPSRSSSEEDEIFQVLMKNLSAIQTSEDAKKAIATPAIPARSKLFTSGYENSSVPNRSGYKNSRTLAPRDDGPTDYFVAGNKWQAPHIQIVHHRIRWLRIWNMGSIRYRRKNIQLLLSVATSMVYSVGLTLPLRVSTVNPSLPTAILYGAEFSKFSIISTSLGAPATMVSVTIAKYKELSLDGDDLLELTWIIVVECT